MNTYRGIGYFLIRIIITVITVCTLTDHYKIVSYIRERGWCKSYASPNEHFSLIYNFTNCDSKMHGSEEPPIQKSLINWPPFLTIIDDVIFDTNTPNCSIMVASLTDLITDWSTVMRMMSDQPNQYPSKWVVILFSLHVMQDEC